MAWQSLKRYEHSLTLIAVAHSKNSVSCFLAFIKCGNFWCLQVHRQMYVFGRESAWYDTKAKNMWANIGGVLSYNVATHDDRGEDNVS